MRKIKSGLLWLTALSITLTCLGIMPGHQMRAAEEVQPGDLGGAAAGIINDGADSSAEAEEDGVRADAEADTESPAEAEEDGVRADAEVDADSPAEEKDARAGAEADMDSPAEAEDGAQADMEGGDGAEESVENPEEQSAEAPRLRAPVAGSEIFLDGQNGNDDNDGTSKATAVRTFAKARDLAANIPSVATIWVCGTCEVKQDVSLAGTNAKLMRYQDFTGYLLQIAAGETADFSNITLDGNSGSVKANHALIYVKQGATLNILDGTVLQNNHNDEMKRSYGGAIEAYQSAVNMSGGLIQNNSAVEGGGICLNGAAMTFTGGTIQNNEAKRYFDSSISYHYGAGGGILLTNGAQLDMSGNAYVKNNQSAEIGGGISVGSIDWSASSDLLTMSGGIVEGNMAGAAGGGIFIQAGLGSRVSKAVISAGMIVNNEMSGTGFTNKAFGGGGIYVNGMPPVYYGLNWVNGELHLTNAVIANNQSAIAGGGLASCPVSKTYIFLKEGAALFGNSTATNSAKDFYLLSALNYPPHSGEPDLKLASRMLGGLPYDWKDDDGNPVDISRYQGTIPDGSQIRLHTDNGYTAEEIAQLAKVIISGNTSATRGGGIGSNGTIIIGEDQTIDLQIIKNWDQALTPEPVEVELRARLGAKDWLIERVTLDGTNHFAYSFKDLPAAIGGQPTQNLVYIKENSNGQYTAEVSPVSVNAEGKFVISLTNSPLPTPTPTTTPPPTEPTPTPTTTPPPTEPTPTPTTTPPPTEPTPTPTTTPTPATTPPPTYVEFPPPPVAERPTRIPVTTPTTPAPTAPVTTAEAPVRLPRTGEVGGAMWIAMILLASAVLTAVKKR